ncbi:hypothetical protein GCM10008986_20190 [Salinibacillus aidingensis]|uniref:HTH arsR-type domain-containing protein n=1 Tax=Salinibacillus aidingensis TaxID=237684 RepID=A0ABN1BBD1_9BACI
MENDNLNDVFQALAHPIRRTIIDVLSHHPLTTGEICDHFDVSRYAVMKHLNILEASQLVLTRKKGREKINYFHAVPLQEVYRRWMNRFQAEDADSLMNVKNFFEEKERVSSMPNLREKDSFQISQEISIQGSKTNLFKALTEDIDQWWSIRLFDDSELFVENEIGGRFMEKSADGKQALWATIMIIKPNEELHFQGPLGITGAVNSYYKFKLRETAANETILQLDHTVYGMIDPAWEKDYREGWNGLLHNFKQFFTH